jgi:hypothetical protein
MNCTTLQCGWWVVLTLERDTAPLRSYAGQIKDLDDRGLRVAMIDWSDGSTSNGELFVPWSSIMSAMVISDVADLAQFEERAAHWQRACASLGGEFDREKAQQSRCQESVRPRQGPHRERRIGG